MRERAEVTPEPPRRSGARPVTLGAGMLINTLIMVARILTLLGGIRTHTMVLLRVLPRLALRMIPR